MSKTAENDTQNARKTLDTVDHIAVAVDDVEKAVDWYCKTFKCNIEYQDKTWAFDPDGNEWEVFVVLEDNLTQTTMCCLPDANGVSSCEVPASVTIPVAEPVAAGCEPGSGCC